MAEYYPLLAKAVGSLPNSTLETRRVVYERARKALIGQLRTLHPPIPDEDIERESVELDRAVQRLEGEIARGNGPAKPAVRPPPASPAAPASVGVRPGPLPPSPGGAKTDLPNKDPLKADLPNAGPSRTDVSKPNEGVPPAAAGLPRPPRPPFRVPSTPVEAGVPAARKPPPIATPPVRSPVPGSAALPSAPGSVARVAPPLRTTGPIGTSQAASQGVPIATALVEDRVAADEPRDVALPADPASGEPAASSEPSNGALEPGRSRADGQRPFAPQVPTETPRRKTWIVPLGIAIIVAAVAVAAYMLRDTRQFVRAVPTESTPKTDNGKIAERVGRPVESGPSGGTTAPAPTRGAATTVATPTPSPKNPEVPVAQRAALLIEAPDEPNKVKTFLGSVVWKLNNVNQGPSDGVGLAVEADVDLPEDKMKAIVTFEKNTDASLPASHTIKIRFAMQPGSPSGDVQQISVPQLRQEDSPSGEALAGVTVPVVQNSFLVGLSPGNAESANMKQIKDMQWIDVPMLLSNGKIAKLTFEKGSSGERDIDEAINAWQKS